MTVAMAIHYSTSSENQTATMQTEPSFYSNLTSPYEDVLTVPYPYTIQDDESERKAEEHMKTLINDWEKSEEMGVGAIHIRLKSQATGQAINRTFLIDYRDQEGNLGGNSPKCIHHFDEHGNLHTVGTKHRQPREKGRMPVYKYRFWEEPQPYGTPPAAPTLKPRQEESIKIAKDESKFHPECMPYDGQVRLTFSFTNDYKRSLVKKDLLDNATAFANTPATKKSIERHGFDEKYTGKVLRIITHSPNDGIDIHYFQCIVAGKSNKFHVVLDKDILLKNWAPLKHVPQVKAYLNIE